jgi:GT2 family glycosyltransferase
MNLKSYTTLSGHELVYTGSPELSLLDELAKGPGDCWHSSFEQGYKNVFQELSYQTRTAWWYINDFNNLDRCVSWRINPYAFVIRKSVWEILGGFDTDYFSDEMKGLALGYDLTQCGGIPIYIKGLFTVSERSFNNLPIKDQYIFYRKKFIAEHSLYMLMRKGFWKPHELKSFIYAKKHFSYNQNRTTIPARALTPIQGKPTVSYIIPTMMRQDYTLTLLGDLAIQTYPPSQVIVVDATPEAQRNNQLYEKATYPFELIVKWQTSKGSCRARNEAIALCTGEYIVFGDDDIRVSTDFIEKHIRVLQTYDAGACNGLDIRAEHKKQDINDLQRKLKSEPHRNNSGLTHNFSNANSCVRRDLVNQLIGNDVNYDGGYGEDADFGISLSKIGVTVLFNPFSANLHLKPPAGGYRWWGSQAKQLGKKRKTQPWELDVPVKWIRPVPSPTTMYTNYKQYTAIQRKEFKYKYLLYAVIKGNKSGMIWRLFKLPYRILQYNRSVFYAKRLMARGIQYH